MPIFKVEMLDDEGTSIHVAAAQIADADVTRFFTAYHANYNETGVGNEPPNYTDEELWRVFAAGWLQKVISTIQTYERREAAKLVVVDEINFTPLPTA